MADRPNILILFTDDQRFDTIAALGNTQIKTPNLDKLVARGTTFTRAHIMGGTCGAICMPSRAMLHTGRTLFHLQEQGQHIPKEHTTMGECFAAAGYQTFGTGKWHNGRPSFARSFTDGGEIYFGGMMDHWNMPAYHYDPQGKYENTIPECFNPQATNRVIDRPADHIVPGKHSTDIVAEAVIDFIGRRDRSKPFMAYTSFLAPHDPRTMPKKYLDMYNVDEIELPPNYMPGHPFDNGNLRVRDEMLEEWPRTKPAIRQHIAEYYAMITHLDDRIGDVISALEQSDDLANTIIVFAGDNGLAVGQHGLMGKQNMYDHSVRVPLIFAGPGVPQNQQSESYCYLLDIFATLCDLTGVTAPTSNEGLSLKPALDDASHHVRDMMHCAYVHLQRSVRDQQYKLIEYHVDGVRTTQLFDIVNDPWELNDLSDDAKHADDIQRLRVALHKWRDDYDDPTNSFWQAMT